MSYASAGIELAFSGEVKRGPCNRWLLFVEDENGKLHDGDLSPSQQKRVLRVFVPKVINGQSA
jgi:hypothetical protein